MPLLQPVRGDLTLPHRIVMAPMTRNRAGEGNAPGPRLHADPRRSRPASCANPDLPRRFAEDLPLYAPDRDTFQGGGEDGYTDYPFSEETAEARAAGRER